MRCKSSFGISSSSLRVPERWMSIAGKVRLSTNLRSRMISELPVLLEFFEDHVVHAGTGVDEGRRDDGE